MIQMRIAFEEAQSLILQIPHQSCRDASVNRWKAGGSAGVTAQSICRLFCWGKTGMGSHEAACEAQRAFNTVFDKPFDWFDTKIDHERARAARYSGNDIESDLQRLLRKES
jgi:hypothetical protein